MKGKRSVLLCMSLLFSFYLTATSGVASADNEKLTGALKDLSVLYKTQAKFTPHQFGKMLIERSIQIRSEAGLPPRGQTEPLAVSGDLPKTSSYVDENGRTPQYFPIFRETVILEEVQKRMGKSRV